jgi:hypothetical protein
MCSSLLDLNGFTLTKSGLGMLKINNIVRDGGMIINPPGSGSVLIANFIPEPSSMLLVMFAAAGMTLASRRR